MATDRKISLGKWGAMTGYDSATEYPMKITDMAGDGTSVAGKMLVGKADGSGNFELVTASATGDVSGPGSSTDNAIVRWNGVGGTSIQNSAAILDDNDNLYLPGTLNVTDAVDLDSTLNVDGNVTIGGDVTHTNSASLANHTITTYSESANASQIYQQKARGTLASPAIVQTDDFLSNYRSDAWDGVQFVRVMSQRVRVEGTTGAGDVRGRMVWAAGQQTTPNSDPEDPLMTLTASNANPRLGMLDVTGDITVRGISVGSGGISTTGLSSTTSVIAAIDTDANSTSEVFAVRSNGSGTNQFSVSEAGNIMGLGTLTLGSGPTTVTDSAGKVLAAALNTVTVPVGGTGATTLTGLLQGNGTSAFTAITDSSTVGQVLRCTGANTYAWGALNLADTAAVTGTLPASAVGSGSFTITGGTINNAAIGGSTPAAGAFTTLAASSTANITGQITSGVADTTAGILNATGNNTTQGGRVRTFNSLSEKGTYSYFMGEANGSSYRFGTDLNAALFTFGGDGSFTATGAVTCSTTLTVNGNVTLGDSPAADTITCTGRTLLRGLSAASSVDMTGGEIAYYSGNWYGHTGTRGTTYASATPVRFLTTSVAANPVSPEWRTWIPARAGNGDAVGTISTYGLTRVYGADMDTGLDKEWYAQFAVPTTYSSGSFKFRIYLLATTASGGNSPDMVGTVGGAMSTNDAATAPSDSLSGAPTGGTDWLAGYAAGDIYIWEETKALTGVAAGDLCSINIHRNGSGDSYAGSILLVGVEVTYS